jgi:hypothetical protein
VTTHTKTVLVAYDGSAASRRALEHAADLVGQGGTVTVVNVVSVQSVGSRLQTVSDQRHPGGEDQLEPWDIVFFSSGPAGTRLVWNSSGSTARVAMFSSITAVGAVVYPDSYMINIFTTDGADDIVVKRTSAVDVAAPWSTRQGEPEAET